MNQLGSSTPYKESPRDFSCPISFERFRNPVVDENGHTFEKIAIDLVYKRSVNFNLPFKCPLTDTEINYDRIVKNYTLASILDDYSALKDEIQDLKKQKETRQEQNQKIQNQCDLLNISVQPMLDTMKDAISIGEKIVKENEMIVRINQIREKNLKNFSFWDRLWAFFFPHYLNSIVNLGITADELKFLEKMKPSAKIQKLIIRINDLKEKIII